MKSEKDPGRSDEHEIIFASSKMIWVFSLKRVLDCKKSAARTFSPVPGLIDGDASR